MRAITYHDYGPAEVLAVEEIAKPSPKSHEILIRVRAVEATKADCEMRAFKYAVKWFRLPMRLALGIRRPRRRVLGIYFSGEIESVAGDVAGFAPGDRVFGTTGFRSGAYAEYIVLPARSAIVPMPRSMTFAEAAAVPLGGLNALHFMRRAAIQGGERVLINGAGGSIGSHAVQIAKAMGAHVTAVDSSIKQHMLRRIGADRFVDYEAEDFAANGERYDVIFDMVPGSSYRRCIDALNRGGRYLAGNPRLSFMLRSVITTRLTDKRVMFAFAHETREELRTLKAMVESGQIVANVDRVYPMEQAPEAHRRVETEQRAGAVVIAIGG